MCAYIYNNLGVVSCTTPELIDQFAELPHSERFRDDNNKSQREIEKENGSR